MKGIVIITIIVLNTLMLSAQKGKIVSAINYLQNNEPLKAKEMIDSAAVNEKTKNLSKTWFVKGKVYQAIYESQKPELLSTVKNPLEEAYTSYMKAIEIDKDDYNPDMTFYLKNLKIDYINKGVNSFNEKDFVSALELFEHSIAIAKLPAINSLDTAIYYNAGISAYYSKKYDKAIEFFNVAIKNNYKKLNTCLLKLEIYQTIKDSTNYLNTLNETYNTFPDNEGLILQMANHYISSNNNDKAMEFVNKLIEKAPNNATYSLLLGNLYDKMGKQELAQLAYEKAIKNNPNSFDAYFNLAVTYFNTAVDIIDKTSNIPLKEKARYDEEITKANDLFKISLPYFEKAYELNKSDTKTLQILAIIYTKLKMDDKAKTINDILKPNK